jgi:hypothetical protein
LKITDSNHHDNITIPLKLSGCMVHFKHSLPTKVEFMSLHQYCLTQGDTPWNPSSFSDQVADVFYKQIIDTESYKENSMKFSPYDPSDTYENSIIGKSAILTFCPKMIMKVQVSQAMPVNTDPHYSKTPPNYIDYQRLSPNFSFRPHDMIQKTFK